MILDEIFQSIHSKGQSPSTGQQTAIEIIEGSVLVGAGPGSGITNTLIIRTLNLILNHEVRPEKILLLTFTEKAARQLRYQFGTLDLKLEKIIAVLSASYKGVRFPIQIIEFV